MATRLTERTTAALTSVATTKPRNTSWFTGSVVTTMQTTIVQNTLWNTAKTTSWNTSVPE